MEKGGIKFFGMHYEVVGGHGRPSVAKKKKESGEKEENSTQPKRKKKRNLSTFEDQLEKRKGT